MTLPEEDLSDSSDETEAKQHDSKSGDHTKTDSSSPHKEAETAGTFSD